MRACLDRFRLVVVSIAAVSAMVVLPGAVSAHTDVDFTAPADSETVKTPVDEVTVAFTARVELVGNGFEALDPQGNPREPAVVSDDGRVFRLRFDPPLAGGGVGIRYEIRAEDGHVLTGAFSFVVDAPVPTTAPPTTAPAPAAPATTGNPATSAPTTPDATDPAPPASTTTVASTTTASPTTAGTSTTIATVAAGSGPDDGSGVGVVVAILAAAALGVGGFLVVRTRTSGAPSAPA